MKDSKQNSDWQKGFDSSGAVGEVLGQMGVAGMFIAVGWFLLTLLWSMISLVRKTDGINDYYKEKKL